jgi:hypothetical protein
MMPLPDHVIERYSRVEYAGNTYYGAPIDSMTREELLVVARALAFESQRQPTIQQPLPKLPRIRVPIRPIANNSGGKFDARREVETLKEIVRQLTDYVNELRRDVDRLQGYGE